MEVIIWSSDLRDSKRQQSPHTPDHTIDAGKTPSGDRRHDAYAEKLRRSVEAVQEYNAGRDMSEQFAITGSLLRQLTGVKPGKVKQWMDENKAALDGYNAGYSARQNVGKVEPRSVIKWSEAAYGV